MKPYTIMLVLTDKAIVPGWVEFALRLLPEKGILCIRGLVSVETDKSLSEGTTLAREWRDALRQNTHHDIIHDEIEVYVGYQPCQRVVEEIQLKSIDLLLIEWNPGYAEIGGLSINDILQTASCDVVLASNIEDINASQRVLLSLRGGPNLSLGTYFAATLANDQPITLFHAVDKIQITPNLKTVMRLIPQITRVVTAKTKIIDGIIKESAEHDVIVMGAGLQKSSKSAQPTIFQQVYERSHKPIMVVRSFQPENFRFHAPHCLTTRDETLSVKVDRWFAENTFHSSEFDDLKMLMALKEKQGVTISVALPALNEEVTIEKVIKTIKTSLMDRVPIIDELILIDSDSTDNTVAIAETCEIPTYIHQQILADEVSSRHGKGEALWKSLYVTKGDIIVWIDTDITNIHPRFIYGLLGPLLMNSRIQYVKGFYARPIKVGNKLQSYGGGRVTELVARPMLNLFFPELSGIVQPLSGEYAGRRTTLEQLPFFSGYGVETGLLVDILNQFGLDAIAQTDLEVRVHHNQSLTNLSKMSFAILQVLIARLENRFGFELLEKANRSMKLITQEHNRFALDIAEISDYERPPMISIPAYEDRQKRLN